MQSSESTSIYGAAAMASELKGYLNFMFIAEGAYGKVVKGFDTLNQEEVAIKIISDVSISSYDSSKIIREVFLLHSLKHENILGLKNISFTNKTLYVITDFFEFDLHKIIYRDKDESPGRHNLFKKKNDYIYVLYQMLNVMRHLHSLGVLHRDIKPANILINQRLQIKLCDFGLARLMNTSNEYRAEGQEPLTEYVVTRWYRAPEVYLNPGNYGKAQDVWSMACTFCEIFRRYPLFPGRDTVDQVRVIADTMGCITASDLRFEMIPAGKRFMKRIKPDGLGIRDELKIASRLHPKLVDLLVEMLQFNPNLRISASDAVEWRMFRMFHHEETDEVQEICREDYEAYQSSVNSKMNKSELIQALQNFIDDIHADIQRQALDLHFDNISAGLRDDDDRASVISNASVRSDTSMVSFLNAVPEGLNRDGTLAMSHRDNMTDSLGVFPEPKFNFFSLSRFTRSLRAVAPVESSTNCKKTTFPASLSRSSSTCPVANLGDSEGSHSRGSVSHLSSLSSAKIYNINTDSNPTEQLPSNSVNTNDFLTDQHDETDLNDNFSITNSSIFRDCKAYKSPISTHASKGILRTLVYSVWKRLPVGVSTKGATNNTPNGAHNITDDLQTFPANKFNEQISDDKNLNCGSNSNTENSKDQLENYSYGINTLRKDAVNALEDDDVDEG